MVLKSPDMTSCNEKVKCLGGVNSGLAYDPSDPCPEYSQFNDSACNCEAIQCYRRATIYYSRTTGGYTGCNTAACYEGPLDFRDNYVFFPVAIDPTSLTSINFSRVSTQCTGGTPVTLTYAQLFGVDYWYGGNSNWPSATTVSLTGTSGISDGLVFVATGVNDKTYAGWLTTTWSGAVGCTYSSATLIGADWDSPVSCT